MKPLLQLFLFICLCGLLPQKTAAQTNTGLLCPKTVFAAHPETPALLFSAPVEGIPAPFVFDASIPHGAVFCRMESKIYERYNFRFKIHAGEGDKGH